MMHTKSKPLHILIQAAVWILTIVSTVFLVRKTAIASTLLKADSLFLFAEVFVIGLWFFIALFYINQMWLSMTVMAAVAYIYLWMHRIALPVLLSGAYIFYLIVAGEALLNIINGDRREDRIRRISHDFIIGGSLHLSIVALLSVFNIGGAVCARITAIVIFVLSAVYIGVIRFSKKRISIPLEELPSETEIKKEEKSRLWICVAIAVLCAMALLQAGRINITLDYDSLHYGLRSRYVLDAGKGIYENLGSVNDVYVYPKGLETLLLPLTTEVTYGYVLSFSWWMSCGVLIVIYWLVKKMNCRRVGIYAAMFAATIPGIMNMGISAKTDIITVLIQLMAIMDLLSDDYVWAGTELLFSLIFKPTSFLFSGIIFITALVYLIIKKKRINMSKWFVSVPVILAFCFITARTIMLTGVPVTAAASGVWKILGFVPRYPFNCVMAFGKNEDIDLIKRVIGFFFCPVTEDLFHVYIAWGGIGTVVMLVPGLLNDGNKLIRLLTLIIFAVSVLCIFTLRQVDGNYFMLLYALITVMFFSGSTNAVCILLPVIIMNILICGTTNWSGSVGLTPVRLRHYGFYDHESDAYDKKIAEGCKEIYEFLAHDRRKRVVAFANQPDCFDFKCIVQSYTDIEGSGGNVYLVKTLDSFNELMNYSQTDYIYVNDEFLAGRERASDIISYMIEDGSLMEIINEGNNRLYEYVQK